MNIAVYEHICGGGYAQQPLPATVLAEGFAILSCFVSDLKSSGHEVTVLLDERISKLNTPIEADFVLPIVYQGEAKLFLKRITGICDAAFVIAPETGGMLQSIVQLIEATGKTSLNCSSDSISAVADKSVLYERIQKTDIAFPKTKIMKKIDNSELIRQTVEGGFFYPVVFKPTDGTSCGGISLVRSQIDIAKALNKTKMESQAEHFIIQEYVAGEPASVCVLCNGKKAKAISLNRQTVNLNAPSLDSCYQGGCVPFDHPLKDTAFSVAEKTAELFPGLRGFIGVDVILAQNQVYIIDLNPRLTTSYVGLREVTEQNLAQELVDAAISKRLPQTIDFKGVSCFAKAQTAIPTVEVYQKTVKNTSILSPPFPFTKPAVALLKGHGQTHSKAAHRLEEAKKGLHRIMS